VGERERKLLQALEQAKTLEELVDQWIIYGRPVNHAPFRLGERAHMKKHLEDLMRRGLVRQVGDRYERTSA